MKLAKEDIILLDDTTEVKVVWSNDKLVQVEYKDLTRRLISIKQYKITKK